jgi:hypothetical protein
MEITYPILEIGGLNIINIILFHSLKCLQLFQSLNITKKKISRIPWKGKIKS